MASEAHAIHCPNCEHTWFREERIVELDASVVIRDNLPLAAQTVSQQYRYVCTNCHQVLHHDWSRKKTTQA